VKASRRFFNLTDDKMDPNDLKLLTDHVGSSYLIAPIDLNEDGRIDTLC